MLTRLNSETVAAAIEATARTGETAELLDDQAPGLRLQVDRSGARWLLLGDVAGAGSLRVPLGAWPAVGILEARLASSTIRTQLGLEGARQAGISVHDLLQLYDRRKLSQLRRGRGTFRSLEAALWTVKSRDATSLTRREIGLIIDDAADRAPVQANRMLAYLKAFFGWAVGRGYMETNPASPVSKPFRETARDRAPDLSELVRIWRAASALGYPFGPAIQLLLLTAARREEVGSMRVEELCVQPDGVILWTLPPQRSKNHRAIRTALPPLASKVLGSAFAQRPGNSPWVFSSNGVVPISGWSKAKRRLDLQLAALGEPVGESMQPWRLHDLRRSFATLACEVLKVEATVADRCLNHVGASTTSTIARVGAVSLTATRLHQAH